jgi:hypothetical protein
LRLPSGVLVPDRYAADVADALRAHIRHIYSTDLALAELCIELARVADEVAEVAEDSRRRSTLASAPVTIGVAEYSRATGIPERTIRYRCQTGRLPSEKVRSRWQLVPPTPNRSPTK